MAKKILTEKELQAIIDNIDDFDDPDVLNLLDHSDLSESETMEKRKKTLTISSDSDDLDSDDKWTSSDESDKEGSYSSSEDPESGSVAEFVMEQFYVPWSDRAHPTGTMDQPIDAPDLPEDMFSPEQTSFLQKLFRDILTTMREKEAYYKQLLDSHVALQQEFAEFKSAVSAVAEDEEREVTALSVPLKPQKAPSERKSTKVKAPSEQKSQQKPPRAVLKIVEPQVVSMEFLDIDMLQEECAAIVVILEQTKKKRKKVWVKNWSRKRHTLSRMELIRELRISSASDLKNYMRMDDDCFEYLLNLVKPYIAKKDTVTRKSLFTIQNFTPD
ncbi:hypothetical protein FQA39_LY16334 [Lamprigera yunnana]|nr:hypothetical protein FQA39_LY16334 [Lamprigera yunnana]